MASASPVLGDGTTPLQSIIRGKLDATARVEPSQPDPPATSGGQIITGAVELDRAQAGHNRAKPGTLRNVSP